MDAEDKQAITQKQAPESFDGAPHGAHGKLTGARSHESPGQEPRVSAVIPVHNAGGYIARCIESLRAQTLQELEFVFVDDRSEDGSMAAVKQWAADDPRVRIVRNEANLGEGGSRNAGIRAARGGYFCSLDPDNWIAPDYFELLYREAAARDADIVKGTRIRIDEASGQEILPLNSLNKQIREALARHEPLYLAFTYEHQTAIFKRALFCDDTLYGTSSNACDTTFLLRICSIADTISFANDARYYYLQRSGSATRGFSAKRSFAELVSLEEQIEELSDSNDQTSSLRYLARHISAYSGRFFLALANGRADEADKTAYIAKLIALIGRIFGHEKLFESLPELRYLVESGILLPSRISSSKDAYPAEIGQWVELLQTPSASLDQALIDRFAYLLASFAKRQLHRQGPLKATGTVVLQLLKLGLFTRHAVVRSMARLLRAHLHARRLAAKQAPELG